MTMTLPPPVIVETYFCPRCKSDVPRPVWVPIMFSVSPGQAHKGLPVLTLYMHKPPKPNYCGGVVYVLDKRANATSKQKEK